MRGTTKGKPRLTILFLDQFRRLCLEAERGVGEQEAIGQQGPHYVNDFQYELLYEASEC